jgi:acylphosphatase
MNARVHCLISGRVQGVAFRWFAEREASALGLAGWARNLADGRVEVLAEGPSRAVEAFVGRLRVGPSMARVDDVTEGWSDFKGDLQGFEIRRGW